VLPQPLGHLSVFRINDLRAVFRRLSHTPPNFRSHSSISFALNGLMRTRTAANENCVRPPNVPRSLMAVLLSEGTAADLRIWSGRSKSNLPVSPPAVSRDHEHSLVRRTPLPYIKRFEELTLGPRVREPDGCGSSKRPHASEAEMVRARSIASLPVDRASRPARLARWRPSRTFTIGDDASARRGPGGEKITVNCSFVTSVAFIHKPSDTRWTRRESSVACTPTA
jgi:hypothetical protein